MALESSENTASSRIVRRKEAKSIQIDAQGEIWSVAFLVDGKHVLGGGKEGRVRRWRVQDGREVETPIMNAQSPVHGIAVSPDGKWIVSGSHRVAVWNARTREKVAEILKGQAAGIVCAIDVSPGSTRIATAREDGNVYIWSLDPATVGEQLLGPLQHDYPVVSVKFAPKGRLIATATQWGDSPVRVYDSQSGHLLADFPVRVNSLRNQSLAWASDNKQLLALSVNGDINCLDATTGATLSRWLIHSSRNPTSILVASNGAFIATSGDFSVSFWDPTTHKQIGSIIQHTEIVESMAISANYDIVIGGGQSIIVRCLHDILPLTYCNDTLRNPATWHKNVAVENGEPLLIQDEGPEEKIANLEKIAQELRNQLTNSQRAADQEKLRFSETVKSLGEKEKSSDSKIAHLEQTVQQLHAELADSQKMTNRLTQILGVHEQKHHCEILYAEGRIIDAAESFLGIMNAVNEEIRTNKLLVDWLTEFTNRCTSRLVSIGDNASNVGKYDEAFKAYFTALLLATSTSNTVSVLVKWAKMVSIRGIANEALDATIKFRIPRFVIYQTICDVLEGDDHISKAVECYLRMQSELKMDGITMQDEQAQWKLDFRRRCTEKLKKLSDSSMGARKYDDAAKHLSTMLFLDPTDRLEVLIGRSKARASMSLWEDALDDADEAIELDPLCHLGYEMRYAALYGARRHEEAAKAFHMLLSKLDASPDQRIRELGRQYVDATPTIRHVVEQTVRNMPRVLIDTTTGRLCDKKQQVEAFEALPVYSEMVSSMTTELDHARIWREVETFYKYVMLSHRWEQDEPLLQKVERITVYKLESSLANVKLQTFCTLVRSLGFRWAWSDTCCVDKVNNVVLQESLVAMFTWYRGSSLTVVYLRGVSSQSQGGLRESVWNTRAWTYQEYVAAEIIQFYAEDWKPYLGLQTFNHKESPSILAEMEQATGRDIAILRPGLDRAREKLYLASMRKTTLVEDIAYSLLGIFNAAIPVIYGEGNRAVGRFLEHILTGSGDVTILAWTGHAGSYNSCLPPDLTVYDQLVPVHVPQPIEATEMEGIIAGLRVSLGESEMSEAMTLYDRLNRLPSPSFTASRLSLPGIVFPATHIDETSCSSSVLGSSSGVRVYRATTSVLGEVEIKTTETLSVSAGNNKAPDLLLVHPWISPLLDQEFSRGTGVLDDVTRALRLVARLKQPFGALVFVPVARARYRRVAADGMVVGRVREGVRMGKLVEGIRTIDVQ